MDRNEIWHDPRHLGVPSGTSKIISKPIERSAQTVQLSCDKITTISKRTKMSFHLSLVNLEYHLVRLKWFSDPMVHLVQTLHLFCFDNWHRHGMDRSKTPHEPQNLWVPSALSETISKPIVRLAQTMHLSCTDTNTVSKWTETRFTLTHDT
jgi:hypothetical protein